MCPPLRINSENSEEAAGMNNARRLPFQPEFGFLKAITVSSHHFWTDKLLLMDEG